MQDMWGEQKDTISENVWRLGRTNPALPIMPQPRQGGVMSRKRNKAGELLAIVCDECGAEIKPSSHIMEEGWVKVSIRTDDGINRNDFCPACVPEWVPEPKPHKQDKPKER